MIIPRWLKLVGGAVLLGGAAFGVKKALHKEEVGGDVDPEDTEPPAADAPPAPPSGTFMYPVPSGKVTSPFGQRTDPVTGAAGENHNGVDFHAPEGTPLKAPGAGTVTRVWNDDLNGNAMKIKIGDKTLGFAHLQSDTPYPDGAMLQKGAAFAAGDVIAHTGGGGPHEGKSTGPHLHMTMRDSTGTLVDPLSVTWSAQA